MIASYTISTFDGIQVATVLVDITAVENEYGALTALEEGCKVACGHIEELHGDLLDAEEDLNGFVPELPFIGGGWILSLRWADEAKLPLAFRWADGFEPLD